MKKRNLFFALLLIAGLSRANAQSYKHAFSINIGGTQDGYGVMLSHNYFYNGYNSIATSIIATNANYSLEGDKIQYNDLSLTLGYTIPLLITKNNKFGIIFESGGLIGYEIVNNNKNPNLSNGNLILDKSKAIFGAYGGIGLDYLINDQMTVFIKANEYYHVNSDLGKFVPFAGLGIRYYAN